MFERVIVASPFELEPNMIACIWDSQPTIVLCMRKYTLFGHYFLFNTRKFVDAFQLAKIVMLEDSLTAIRNRHLS